MLKLYKILFGDRHESLIEFPTVLPIAPSLHCLSYSWHIYLLILKLLCEPHTYILLQIILQYSYPQIARILNNCPIHALFFSAEISLRRRRQWAMVCHLLISLKAKSEVEESRRRDGKRKNIGRRMKNSRKGENYGKAKQLEKNWRDKEGELVE